MENHVESCHCWHCGGYGKVSYIRDGDVEDWGHCHDCDGGGELYRAKITQTTVIRAFLTQAKHALEDIDLMDSDLDQIYTKIEFMDKHGETVVEYYDELQLKWQYDYAEPGEPDDVG